MRVSRRAVHHLHMLVVDAPIIAPPLVILECILAERHEEHPAEGKQRRVLVRWRDVEGQHLKNRHHQKPDVCCPVKLFHEISWHNVPQGIFGGGYMVAHKGA